MNLGLAIFLSAIFLGSIWLYYITKDRWNWKKWTKWNWKNVKNYVGVPLLGLIIVGIIIYALIYFLNVPDKKGFDKNGIYKLTSFWGLECGFKMSDVIFIKGKPDAYLEGNVWEYNLNSSIYDKDSYELGFEDSVLSYVLFTGSYLNDPKVYGDYLMGKSTESIESIFGKSNANTNSPDFTRRYFGYKALKLFLGFEKNRVVAYGMICFDISNTR